MKKLTTVFAAMMLVFGFAAICAAQTDFEPCYSCAGDNPGFIDRGCEGIQDYCTPFDFETIDDYCTAKGAIHRAFLDICACPNWPEKPRNGDTLDITMTILVDKGNGPVAGDNGVYWAEDVSSDGIDAWNYPFGTSTSKLCKSSLDEKSKETPFRGPFLFEDANGDPATPLTGMNTCAVPDENRAVVITPDKEADNHGYLLDDNDADEFRCIFQFDIPEMRIDPSVANRGDKVYVQLSMFFTSETGSICPNPCVCNIYIGQICCPVADELVYPYLTQMTDPDGWFGFVITNLSNYPGTAKVTVYEKDGDVATASISIPKYGMYVDLGSNLLSLLTLDTAHSTGDKVLGNAQSFIQVTTDFNASGFAMMGIDSSGESMGYLPIITGLYDK